MKSKWGRLDISKRKFQLNIEFGDVIEIKRNVLTHWAVFIGYLSKLDESVSEKMAEWFLMVLEKQKYDLVKLAPHALIIELNGGLNKSDYEVRILPIQECVLCDKFRVNNMFAGQLSPNAMLERMGSYIIQPAKYNLLTDNCEHFVHKIRYGKSHSSQSKLALTTLLNVSLCVHPATRVLGFAIGGLRLLYKIANDNTSSCPEVMVKL